MTAVGIRSARTADVATIKALVDGYAGRVLLAKELVTLYEMVQEFLVGELDGEVVGCGALHVLWEDLGEIRTVAVAPGAVGHGVGHAIVAALIARARDLGLRRLFVLTTRTMHWFLKRGFVQADVDQLPRERINLYNWQRKSQVLIKNLS